METVLTISDRGQITIPISARKELKTKRVIFRHDKKTNKFTIEPLQTREEFFAELEEISADWKKHGGFTVAEVKAKYLEDEN